MTHSSLLWWDNQGLVLQFVHEICLSYELMLILGIQSIHKIWSHNLCLWQSKVAGMIFVLQHKVQWHTMVCHLYFGCSKMFVDDFSAVVVYCVYTWRADIPNLFTLNSQNRSLMVDHGPRAYTHCIEYTCICQMLQCRSSGAN